MFYKAETAKEAMKAGGVMGEVKHGLGSKEAKISPFGVDFHTISKRLMYQILAVKLCLVPRRAEWGPNVRTLVRVRA